MAFADSRPTVWTKEPAGKVRKQFPANKFRVMDASVEKAKFAKVGYLGPRARAAVFHKLNLDRSLASMDDVDKDMLVMDAYALKMDALRKYYPHLSVSQLSALQREVRAPR